MGIHQYKHLTDKQCTEAIEKIKVLSFEDEASDREKLIDINSLCAILESSEDD